MNELQGRVCKILFIDTVWDDKSEGGPSGSPLLHSGLVGGDGLGCVHTPTVAVDTLEVGVAERSKR